MNDICSLYLLTPVIEAPSGFTDALEAACRNQDVAAVMLRLAPADERTQINRVKILAPIVQKYGAAAIVALDSSDKTDIAAVAARGGADGVHIDYDATRIRDLTERLRGERSLGIGGLRSRDDAMRSGELNADYVMFGEPRPDGFLPQRDAIAERASWWAEIFETPCIAFVSGLDGVEMMTATGAEFVALGDAVWNHEAGPEAAVKTASDILAKVIAERAGSS